MELNMVVRVEHAASFQLKEALGADYRYYQYYKEIREMKGVQARTLMEITID